MRMMSLPFSSFHLKPKILPVRMDLLHIAGVVQAVLLGVFFLEEGKKRGNRIEALLLFCLAATVWIGYLYSTKEILSYPHIARTGFSFLALLGPLFYFSVRRREETPIRPVEFLWFLIPLGIILYLIPFHLSSREHKLAYLKEDLVQVHLDCLIILFFTLANNLGSMISSLLRVYRKNRTWIRESGNRSLVTGHAVYYLLPSLILFTTGVVVALDSQLLNSGYFSGAAALVILIRSYSMLFNRNRFIDAATSSGSEPPSGKITAEGNGDNEIGNDTESYPPAIRYRKSLIPETDVIRIGKKIEAHLEEEKPFLEPDFQLSDLVPVTKLTMVQTSQIVNRHFKESFTDLTRRLRVEEACRLLHSRPDSFSILDIAMESGFNSKSSFNLAFRQIMNCLPSEYRKEAKKESNPAGSVEKNLIEQ